VIAAFESIENISDSIAKKRKAVVRTAQKLLDLVGYFFNSSVTIIKLNVLYLNYISTGQTSRVGFARRGVRVGRYNQLVDQIHLQCE
jgi:hypothetical protein